MHCWINTHMNALFINDRRVDRAPFCTTIFPKFRKWIMLQARRRFASIECDFYLSPFIGNIRWLLNVLTISKTALCGLICRTTCVVLYLSAFMICYVLGFVLRTIWTHLSSSLDPFEWNLWAKCGQRTKTRDDVFEEDLHEKKHNRVRIIADISADI